MKNITVSSVVASADGTSATVNLASDLIADTDTAVAIVSDGDTSNFTVKFTIQTQTLAAVGGIFDKELKGQKIGLTLDGVAVTTDYLAANGYTVEFRAWNAANAVANTALFNTVGEAVSSVGILNNGGTSALVEASYTVQATVRKGSTILTSEKVSVQVADLVNEGSSILSYKMTQNTALKTMNSSTLLVGETTTINNVVVQYSSTNTAELTNGSGYLLSTSNKNVVSVSGYTMTAVAPGTATVTIQVGSLTKTIAVTVAQGTRVPTTVTDSTQVNAVIKADGSIASSKTVTVKDQFGDPVVETTPANLFVTGATTPTYLQVKYALTGSVSGLTVGTITQDTATADKAAGKYILPLTASTASAPADGQVSTVAFTNAAGTNVGSFTVKATGNNSAYSTKIEYQTGSANQTNTLNDSMVNMGDIFLVANNYNSNGVYVSSPSLAGYTIVYNPLMIKVEDNATIPTVDTDGTFTCGAGTTHIKITPVANAKGSTPVTIYKEALQTNLVDTRTISVNAATPKITAVTFKTVTPKLGTTTYADVLTLTTRVSEDPIIQNITLSETTGYDVCIDPADGKTIYLDKNRNGDYDPATEKIGELVFTVHNSTGTGITDPVVNNQVVIAAPAAGSFTYTVWDTTSTTSAPSVVNTQTALVSFV